MLHMNRKAKTDPPHNKKKKGILLQNRTIAEKKKAEQNRTKKGLYITTIVQDEQTIGKEYHCKRIQKSKNI